MSELPWFVAHTRPRCEKKLKDYCEREGFAVTLPLINKVHKYRGKTVTFAKPLFPGYLFLQIEPQHKQEVVQSNHVANFLVVHDQEQFRQQLTEILQALESKMEIFLAPQIGQGCRVKVKTGPLRGMEGWVEKRYGMATVLLRLDFIGQAAAVRLGADELELI